jgi:hypothetical protein
MRTTSASVDPDDLLTEREVARLFGVSPSTIARMSKREVGLQRIRVSVRRIVYRGADVRRLAERIGVRERGREATA